MMKRTFVFVSALAMALATTCISANPGNGKDGKLPPGLEKKAQSGKPLPPGWQKKLRVGTILDSDIYAHARVVAPLGEHGVITVDIEGRILKLEDTSRKILEIIK